MSKPSPSSAATGKPGAQESVSGSRIDVASLAAQQQGTTELAAFVQTLLQQMQSRFQEMSESIVTRIDEMGNRIDELERSIGELMQQAGVEDGENPTATAPRDRK